MIRRLMKNRIERLSKGQTFSLPENLSGHRRILFAVFSRYGDGIISFKVMREFMLAHPQQDFMVVTTHQLHPYAEAVLPACTILSLNKRNPWQLLTTVRSIRRFDADMGLNPWSHGDDSTYIISFARQYIPYKQVIHETKEANLYARVRRYLAMQQPPLKAALPDIPTDCRQILVAPSSTDTTKSLDDARLQRLLGWLREHFAEAVIIIADSSPPQTQADRFFQFRKSFNSSRDFLELLSDCDLFVGVDAGPLHIAQALNIPSIGIFGPTAPQTVLDFDACAGIARDPRLDGVFCFTPECPNPVCLDVALGSLDLRPLTSVKLTIKNSCVYE